MKKGLVVMVGIFLFVLTGCSKTEKISCSRDEAVQEGMKMQQTVKSTLKDHVVTFLEFGTTLEVEEQYRDYFDSTNASLLEEYAVYQEKNGIEIVNKKEELKTYVGVKINLAKVSEEDKKELSLNYRKQTKEEIKAEFESQGYTCK